MKTKSFILSMCLALLFVSCSKEETINSPKETRVGIKMQRSGGTYEIPCSVNGVKMNFIFDTGASLCSISLTEAMFLYKNGYIDENDIGGKSASIMANGELAINTQLTLKTVEIGGIVLRNVNALVSPNSSAPLLLGQSAIERLGKYEVIGDSLFIIGVVENPLAIQKANNNGIDIDPKEFEITFGDKLLCLLGYEKKVDRLLQMAYQAYQDGTYELADMITEKAMDCYFNEFFRPYSWKIPALKARIVKCLGKEGYTNYKAATIRNKNKETWHINNSDSITYETILCAGLWEQVFYNKSRYDRNKKDCEERAKKYGTSANYPSFYNEDFTTIVELQQALLTYPNNVILLDAMATWYQYANDRINAEKWAKKLVEFNTPFGYFRLGTVHRDLGSWSDAILYFEKCLEAEPNNGACLTNLGDLYVTHALSPEDYKYGISLHKKAAKLGNKNSQWWLKEHNITW